MKNVVELYSAPWDFSLYEVNGNKVITVIFMDRIDFPRTFSLKKEEEKLSTEELGELAESIRKNYSTFKNREIIPPIFE